MRILRKSNDESLKRIRTQKHKWKDLCGFAWFIHSLMAIFCSTNHHLCYEIWLFIAIIRFVSSFFVVMFIETGKKVVVHHFNWNQFWLFFFFCREQQLLNVFEVVVSTLEGKLQRIDNLDKAVEHLMRRVEQLDNRVGDNIHKTESIISKLRNLDNKISIEANA